MDQILESDFDHTLNALSHADRQALNEATILITGCAGFLGFYAMHFLAYRGSELGIKAVIGLDNFILRPAPWLNRLCEKFSHVSAETFDIVDGDLSEIDEAREVTHVLHMASIGSSPFFRKHNIETVDATVWGLRNLLDFYKNSPLKGLLFYSSSEIYGDPFAQFIPTDETYRGNVPCVGPRACYDESKRFGETLCYLYAERYNMPVTVVRPFNTYGPGMVIDDQRAPADFARAIIEGRDIEILSDGSPTRTFCYVSDALAGHLKVLVYEKFDVFNIGMDKPEISIRQLAEIFAKCGMGIFQYGGAVKMGRSPDPFYLSDVPNRRCPDIGKAREQLGYAPTVDVKEGVRRYLEFLKNKGIDQ